MAKKSNKKKSLGVKNVFIAIAMVLLISVLTMQG